MEQRLHETTRFLKSSKSIKMLGLELKVFETISKLRATELGKGMHWVSHDGHECHKEALCSRVALLRRWSLVYSTNRFL